MAWHAWTSTRTSTAGSMDKVTAPQATKDTKSIVPKSDFVIPCPFPPAPVVSAYAASAQRTADQVPSIHPPTPLTSSLLVSWNTTTTKKARERPEVYPFL